MQLGPWASCPNHVPCPFVQPSPLGHRPSVDISTEHAPSGVTASSHRGLPSFPKGVKKAAHPRVVGMRVFPLQCCPGLINHNKPVQLLGGVFPPKVMNPHQKGTPPIEISQGSFFRGEPYQETLPWNPDLAMYKSFGIAGVAPATRRQGAAQGLR